MLIYNLIIYNIIYMLSASICSVNDSYLEICVAIQSLKCTILAHSEILAGNGASLKSHKGTVLAHS